MKELIEKIKKEIKKKIESYMDLQCDFEDHEMSYQEEILDNYYEGCKSGLETAIDIINKEDKSYNNGWIPCSERLPEPIDDMLQCVIVTDENDWQGMAYYHPQKGWVFAECHNSDRKIDWTEIIAWQPLPAPYQPEEGRE